MKFSMIKLLYIIIVLHIIIILLRNFNKRSEQEKNSIK